MSNGPLQYTGQWLIDQLQKLKAAVDADWNRLSAVNGRIMKLAADTNALPHNAPIKDQLYRAIIQMKAKQVVAVRDYNDGAGRFRNFANQAQQWLRDHGYSTTGLGVAPVVIGGAIVVGALFIATVAALWEWHRQNDLKASEQENRLRAMDQLMAAYGSGKLTPQQLSALLAQINSSGTGDTADKLISQIAPIAGIGIGAWLLIQLLRPRPSAAAA